MSDSLSNSSHKSTAQDNVRDTNVANSSISSPTLSNSLISAAGSDDDLRLMLKRLPRASRESSLMQLQPLIGNYRLQRLLSQSDDDDTESPTTEKQDSKQNIRSNDLVVVQRSPAKNIIQRDLREEMHGQWSHALVELSAKLTGVGGIIDRQKDAVTNFANYAQLAGNPPDIGEQIMIGMIELALGAALGGLGTVLKSAVRSAMRPALARASVGLMGSAVDSSEFRSAARSSADAIVDKMITAGKAKVSAAVTTAWSGGGSAGANAILQFKETQLLALNEIGQEQSSTMNRELAALSATENPDDEWLDADALYQSFNSSLSNAYNEQFNKMNDVWFANQVQSIGLGTRAGVLQIELNSRYPDSGSFSISGGNLVGSGAGSDDIRQRLAQRPLSSIGMPKVIRMNGSMGYGIMDCMWNMNVTGEVNSSGPSISAPSTGNMADALMEGPQTIQSISGNRWGIPWLAAYHLGLNDLDGDDERNTRANQHAGARTIWNEIKNMNIGTIGNSSW